MGRNSSRLNMSWNVDAFVEAIRHRAPETYWPAVFDHIDPMDYEIATQAGLKLLAAAYENPPSAYPTHAYSVHAGPLPSEQTATVAKAPPDARAPYDPRRQALLPSNNGGGAAIAYSSHSSKLSSLGRGRSSSTPRSGSLSARG